ncbi:MAG: HD domain-containing protein, partial [Selenomonadales bacterium]|nr:HD domain-containing protein [Selenomonadales bacterium]
MITTLIDQQVYCASPSIHDMTPVFLNLLQMKSPNLYRHSHQVANYSASIAAKMCLPSEEISLIQTAALLHDIGHVT